VLGIKGVKAKELMSSPPVIEITVDEQQTFQESCGYHQDFPCWSFCCWL